MSVLILSIATLCGCAHNSSATYHELGAAAVPDRPTAEAELDQLVETFLELVPRVGVDDLVDRVSEDVPMPCSTSVVQLARFVDVRPRIAEDPDAMIRDVAASLRELDQFEVEEGADLRGDLRLIARDTITGASVLMSQRTLPAFQITAYSPCYPVSE